VTWEVRAEMKSDPEKGECVDAGFVDEVAAARRARRLEKRSGGRRHWAVETPPPKPEPQRSGRGSAILFALSGLIAAPFDNGRRRR